MTLILRELESSADELGYEACQRASLPVTTEMVRYGWVSLDCSPVTLAVSNQVEAISYEFYGAKLSADESRLYFASKWTSRSQTSLDHLKISHQLISEDWENVAQLDRPLAPVDEMSQFAIDVSAVPPGRYRLAAIVYDRDTVQKLDWQEDSGSTPPTMLFLREVEIG